MFLLPGRSFCFPAPLWWFFRDLSAIFLEVGITVGRDFHDAPLQIDELGVAFSVQIFGVEVASSRIVGMEDAEIGLRVASAEQEDRAGGEGGRSPRRGRARTRSRGGKRVHGHGDEVGFSRAQRLCEYIRRVFEFDRFLSDFGLGFPRCLERR